RQDKEQLMAQAVALYHEDQARLGPDKKMGLRTVCSNVAKEHFCNTGRSVSLNHNTLQNLAKGGRTLAELNGAKCWLLKEEIEEVINYTIEIAMWGHGLSHLRLKEHVDEICRARLGDKFPAAGVGKQWTAHFAEKHSERL
ncbi:hypothetical protein C8J56DRAFT_717705, partial [Mycena floridula]